ncbi:hypothetical protein ATZ99_15590 [Thermovenabulum gondwanense]|uniref:Uncharacterized protein n=1 Tax=Thermovenabulum gondwanense TaxID=520767 RepID=A0A162MF13_9FIRM|nr:hypothetical protein ATZ99_15590 [Thermovenabulum gondwanense]
MWNIISRDERKGFWHSLIYGILEGASNTLDIERQDSDGTLSHMHRIPMVRK